MSNGPVWKIELFVPTPHGDAFAEAIELFAGALTLFAIEGTGESRINAYGGEAPDEAALNDAVAAAATAAGVAVPPVHVVWLPDIDWVAENQARFEPVRAGRFHIHDSYHLDPAPAGAVPVMVDAATAFGTGHHGTTRGCLEALDALLVAGQVRAPILDLGCGTGILGIAAAKAARMPVVASDIDPIAVRRARENAAINGVASWMRIFESRGLEAVSVRSHAPFGLVLANILARPLQKLAPAISSARAPGAPVILSGLLHAQEPQVLAAYRTQGLFLRARLRRDEWSTLVLE
ncbi:MAG: 50S ribosomal protein L11 methyltransferase [Alphaproteobacteria bacterium]|nr:50S ribosomal protein L11 methyltransferase [Alphaproteobacteria bacterium]